MTEGHPCFVANNGRLGFGVHEYHAYAPETASPIRLIWLAAHRDHSTFTSAADLDYDRLMREELGDETLGRFAETLAGLGLDLADYHLLPVHPWQWWNKLSVSFAAEVAQRRLVLLGPGDDEYLAQQSIRTFFNTSAPHQALCEDRTVRAEHGLHARPVRRLHGGDAGHQRLAGRPRREGRRLPSGTPDDHP
ncbi:hypothetical protein GCM10020000_37200 [Streptomyces olivoverticillatus]